MGSLNKDMYNDSPIQLYNTRQKVGLYMPVIKTKIYFNSFLAEIDKRLQSKYIKTKIYTQKVRNARKKIKWEGCC